MAQGDAAGAAAALAEAVMRSPDAADLWLELGNALRAVGDTEQALQAYLAALERRPGLAMAHDNAGCVLQDLGRLDDAIRHHRMALEFAPDDPNALRNLGVALQTIGQFDEAIRIYRRALAGPSADAALAGYLGAALTECGRLQEARDAFATALVFAPNDADIRFNHSLLLLKSGDLRRGWREHEWRWRVMPPHRIAQPQWHGEPARGQRILLHAEQGLGDTLQFVRYAPRVAARGLHVILQVQAPLVRLLRGLPGVAEVIADDAPRPEAELHCPLMSLPLAFNTGLDTIPGEPYLAPPPDLLDKWAQHLPPNDRLRVGLAWAGNPRPGEMRSHFTDRRRSVAPALLTPLADAGGVTWVNLQRDAATQPFPMMDPMGAVTDFADTAALVAQLDLVITVDTSVAHLAGAMGKPVWMLSRHDGCWRWLQDRDDSPWYPTMRIFRQTAPDGWPAVIARVSAELARAAAAR
jgi:Flp pilus assembly protein TadD